MHATSYRLAERIPDYSDHNTQKETVEFEILNAKNRQKPRKRNFIKDFDLNKQIETTKAKALYLSRKTRRVKRQTVASKSGLTQNRVTKQKITPFKKLLSEKKGLRLPKAKTPLSAFFNEDSAKNYHLKGGMNLTNQSVSTISTHIPNVDKASITAIDTDKGMLKYYTFYMRLHDQLYPRWSKNINEVITMLSQKKYKYLSQRERVTTLEVILNAKGEYVGHIVVKSSADKMIDFAAIDAFKRAAPFVNPPKDMIEDDGFIYLPFNFRLVIERRLFAGSR